MLGELIITEFSDRYLYHFLLIRRLNFKLLRFGASSKAFLHFHISEIYWLLGTIARIFGTVYWWIAIAYCILVHTGAQTFKETTKHEHPDCSVL